MKKRNLIISILMILMLLPMQVFASSESQKEISLTINSSAGEAEFTFYKVADFSEAEGFEVTEAFQEYTEVVTGMNKLNTGETITTEEWMNMAETLTGYVLWNPIPETKILETVDGVLTWTEAEGLEKALYLVVGQSEDASYQMLPYMMTVPNQDEAGNWIYQVSVDMTKYSELLPEQTSYSVEKIWFDDGYEENRPESISVSLLCDREVYDVVTLSEDNNWRYTWTELEAGHIWKVVEMDVPEEYTVSADLIDTTFVIDNTYTPEEPDSPEKEKLVQSGQLWWPVPVLIICGIVAFTIGWVRRRNSINE